MANETLSVREPLPVGRLIFYWSVVGIPLAWGVYKTLLKLPALFHQ